MNEGAITCPNCDHQFQLSEALRNQIRNQLEGEVKEALTQREVALKKKSEALLTEKRELEKNQAGLEEELAKRLASQREELRAEAKRKLKVEHEAALKEMRARFDEAKEKAKVEASESFELKVKELQEAASERDYQLKEMRAQELELRKEKRELAREREEQEISFQRKLDEQREREAKLIREKLSEDFRIKSLEKDQQIRSMEKSIDDLKRKAEQGSMESQGEALEIDLEDQLAQRFPHDSLSSVGKGVRGADIIQTVRTPRLEECGIILWESKNTKNWSDGWLTKFKDDMREKRAALGILVSVALPDSIKRFGKIGEVWVCDPASAMSLTTALREQLLVLQREELSRVGQDAKMEMIYQYLAGTQFQQKIEGIVEAFQAMQEQIFREKRAMEKQWKEREKQIERVVNNTSGLYGDMQGIIGGQIPIVAALELENEPLKLENLGD